MARHLAGYLAAALLVSGSAAADGTGETMRVGETRDLQFDGKPSTGYQWILDEEGSSGLGEVTVESLGYGEPYTKLLGASAPYRFRVKCEKNGSAELRFDYLAPDRSTVSATELFSIHCE